MAYPEIPALPPAPQRGTPDFAEMANAHVAALTPWTQSVNEAGQFIDQATGGVQQSTEEATTASEEAQGAAGIALSLANFAGRWLDIEGTLAVPASTYHNGQYWALLEDISDVQAEEPGVSAAWASTASLQGEATGPIDMAGFDLSANSVSAERIDYASETINASGTLDLAQRQVFEVDNTAGLLTLEFINLAAVNRGQTIVLDVVGNAGIEFVFPAGITFAWSEGEAPTHGDVWTEYLFMWTGTRLRGGKGLSE